MTYMYHWVSNKSNTTTGVISGTGTYGVGPQFLVGFVLPNL
jgi:hypothetical protein